MVPRLPSSISASSSRPVISQEMLLLRLDRMEQRLELSVKSYEDQLEDMRMHRVSDKLEMNAVVSGLKERCSALEEALRREVRDRERVLATYADAAKAAKMMVQETSIANATARASLKDEILHVVAQNSHIYNNKNINSNSGSQNPSTSTITSNNTSTIIKSRHGHTTANFNPNESPTDTETIPEPTPDIDNPALPFEYHDIMQRIRQLEASRIDFEAEVLVRVESERLMRHHSELSSRLMEDNQVLQEADKRASVTAIKEAALKSRERDVIQMAETGWQRMWEEIKVVKKLVDDKIKSSTYSITESQSSLMVRFDELEDQVSRQSAALVELSEATEDAMYAATSAKNMNVQFLAQGSQPTPRAIQNDASDGISAQEMTWLKDRMQDCQDALAHWADTEVARVKRDSEMMEKVKAVEVELRNKLTLLLTSANNEKSFSLVSNAMSFSSEEFNSRIETATRTCIETMKAAIRVSEEKVTEQNSQLWTTVQGKLTELLVRSNKKLSMDSCSDGDRGDGHTRALVIEVSSLASKLQSETMARLKLERELRVKIQEVEVTQSSAIGDALDSVLSGTLTRRIEKCERRVSELATSLSAVTAQMKTDIGACEQRLKSALPSVVTDIATSLYGAGFRGASCTAQHPRDVADVDDATNIRGATAVPDSNGDSASFNSAIIARLRAPPDEAVWERVSALEGRLHRGLSSLREEQLVLARDVSDRFDVEGIRVEDLREELYEREKELRRWASEIGLQHLDSYKNVAHAMERTIIQLETSVGDLKIASNEGIHEIWSHLHSIGHERNQRLLGGGDGGGGGAGMHVGGGGGGSSMVNDLTFRGQLKLFKEELLRDLTSILDTYREYIMKRVSDLSAATDGTRQELGAMIADVVAQDKRALTFYIEQSSKYVDNSVAMVRRTIDGLQRYVDSAVAAAASQFKEGARVDIEGLRSEVSAARHGMSHLISEESQKRCELFLSVESLNDKLNSLGHVKAECEALVSRGLEQFDQVAAEWHKQSQRPVDSRLTALEESRMLHTEQISSLKVSSDVKNECLRRVKDAEACVARINIELDSKIYDLLSKLRKEEVDRRTALESLNLRLTKLSRSMSSMTSDNGASVDVLSKDFKSSENSSDRLKKLEDRVLEVEDVTSALTDDTDSLFNNIESLKALVKTLSSTPSHNSSSQIVLDGRSSMSMFSSQSQNNDIQTQLQTMIGDVKSGLSRRIRDMDPDVEADHELQVFRQLDVERRGKDRQVALMEKEREQSLRERERVRQSRARTFGGRVRHDSKHDSRENSDDNDYTSLRKDSAKSSTASRFSQRMQTKERDTERNANSPLLAALKRSTKGGDDKEKIKYARDTHAHSTRDVLLSVGRTKSSNQRNVSINPDVSRQKSVDNSDDDEEVEAHSRAGPGLPSHADLRGSSLADRIKKVAGRR